MRAYEIFFVAAIALPSSVMAASTGSSQTRPTVKDSLPVINLPSYDTPPQGHRPNPVPRTNPGTWASTIDYPSSALAQEREGTTSFRVTVNSDGRVKTCTITQSSGHADLDDATCMNVERRAQFWPALDARGNPVEGIWSSRVRWQIPGKPTQVSQSIVSESYPRPPRLVGQQQIKVAPEDYPASAKAEGRQGITKMAIAVDAVGAVDGCTVASSSGHADLDIKACELAKNWRFEPALGSAGEPVAGKSTITFAWRLPKIGTTSAPGISPPALRIWSKKGAVTFRIGIDATGKMVSCKTTRTGELAAGADSVPAFDMCANFKSFQHTPFLDSEGNAHAVTVVLSSSIDHEPFSADAPTAAKPSTDQPL